MQRYVTRRLLQVIPVLLGVSVVVFMLVRLIPGGPATSMLGSPIFPCRCLTPSVSYAPSILRFPDCQP